MILILQQGDIIELTNLIQHLVNQGDVHTVYVNGALSYTDSLDLPDDIMKNVTGIETVLLDTNGEKLDNGYGDLFLKLTVDNKPTT